ncbi:type VI secretion system contractile sheath large subunit [Caulobacter sp. KR2-114]|uniref:type VI secretion system contractile sheath large subunit n=1 Tax=Caulobacter sp. KR2-114 TaxID=3400912 RepID=UPI003BFE4BDC
MTETGSPVSGGDPPGPPSAAPLAATPGASAPGAVRSALADRIGELTLPTADGATPADRLCLFEALKKRFGPDFEGARLEREALSAAIDREIAAIDRALSAQVNAILHAPALQALEARWRGLRYITGVAYDCERAKVRVLSASWGEVVRDLERAADFDQSSLFRKVYTEEFGMPGGEPYGLMIADYEIRHRSSAHHPTDDVGALKALSMVAAAAFCPFIMGVAPRMLQLDSFRELGRPRNLQTVFAQPEYQRWHSVRDGDDMRFIGLTLPRILMRRPYAADPTRVDGFCFREATHPLGGEGHLWGASAFAFGAVVLRAFASNGWFADLRGAPRDELRGGLVTDLTVAGFATDAPGVATKPSVEYQVSEAQERELADLGLIALRKSPYTDFSVFYGNPSLQRPARYDRAEANVNAKLSSMLQYTLCVSRFAHYIKVLGRDRVGSTMTAEQCQEFLNKWLINYCEGSDSASNEVKARYPLREGRVEVRETPGKPGAYSCTVFLRPHYQLDDISTGFRLITELAPKLAA